jgi:glycosyltransferase involved in cell wall biosynthesis
VHFVVPDGIEDADRVSGGNVYDLRIAEALRAHGLDIRMRSVIPGGTHALSRALSHLPRDSVVLIDGLIALAAPDALDAHSSRLRIVVLAHMVASAMTGIGDAGGTIERERRALRAARHVIATSEWTRAELIARALAMPRRITVVHPGSDAAPVATGSVPVPHMLCVGAVAPHKGQDVLVHALAGMTDLPGWTCSIVGSLNADPAFAARTAAAIRSAGLEERVVLTGALTGERRTEMFLSADLVVAPSRTESYGMVAAEALARGIPVVAAHVGGLPEAINGSAAGVLVPADDPETLRAVLRQWAGDPDVRAALKARALVRTAGRTWGESAQIAAAVLIGARRGVDGAGYERRLAG